MSTWLLLRGLTREAGHWGGFSEVLRPRLPDARVVAIDLPGNGQLHALRSPLRVGAMMECCRRQARLLGIEPPFHLLAMSLGAMVAVEWAARHPDEVAAGVLINTSLRPFSPWYRRLRPANYAALLGLALVQRGSRQHEQAVLNLTSKHRRAEAAVLDAWAALREARPVSGINAARQLVAAALYRAPSRVPSVPLLILASAGDSLVDSRCSRQLAQHWGLAIEEHPSAGHDLPLDDAPWVAEKIARWLTRRWSGWHTEPGCAAEPTPSSRLARRAGPDPARASRDHSASACPMISRTSLDRSAFAATRLSASRAAER
jgi:pimeloyl-ACP methyl ester carboxylesterase